MKAHAAEPRGTRDFAILVLLMVAAFTLSYYLASWFAPFTLDDYHLLVKTRFGSLFDQWAPSHLLSNWYRPWSRETHFWTLQHLFGANPAAFRTANLLLWLGGVLFYALLVRDLLGIRAAIIATAGTCALAVWGVLVLWPSGSQDLWLFLLSMAFLRAHVLGHRLWAAIALVGALLSKETAALLPVLALCFDRMVARTSWMPALRRAAPLVLIVGVWLFLHPTLLTQLRAGPAQPGSSAVGSSIASIPTAIASEILRAVNLAPFPRPVSGWAIAALLALPGAVILFLFVRFAEPYLLRTEKPAPRAASTRPRFAPRRVAAFGATWAVLFWLPLALPSVGPHAYYGMLGLFGCWMVFATVLQRDARLALAIVTFVALLRPAIAATRGLDFGTEWYQRRVGSIVRNVRGDLQRRHPTLPNRSRIYLGNVPWGSSLIDGVGSSNAIRTWYADSSLRTDVFTRYRARARGDTAGIDVFFMSDSLGHLTELRPGAEPVPSPLRSQPLWEIAEWVLAEGLYRGGNKRAALAEYQKLVANFPSRPDHARMVAVCTYELGDSVEAYRWWAKAESLTAGQGLASGRGSTVKQ